MSEPFLAEVRIFGFNFSPRGWAHCDGQILPINQNQSLFSLLGTTYGGDGETTFGLPDLRGRAALHEGDGISLGATGLGEETHSLSVAEMPSHTHPLKASSANASSKNPAGNVYARAGSNTYHEPGSAVSLHGGTVAHQGSGQGHDNMQPFLVLNFCIALQGLFPSRN